MFTVNSAHLKAAINTVSKAVPSKGILPILSCIMFQLDGDNLTLTGTDLQIGIQTLVTVDNKTGESIRRCVSSDKLQAFLNTLSETELKISLENDMVIQYGKKSKITIHAMTAEDFPRFTERKKDSVEVNLRAALLQTGIDAVKFAIAKDAAKNILTSMYLTSDEKNLYFVATDGYRLSEYKTAQELPKFGIMLPNESLALLKKLEGDEIKLTVSDAYALFESDEGTKITVRCLEGKFPDWQKIIPKEHKLSLDVSNKVGLIKALDRVMIMASEQTRVATLTSSGDEIIVSAEAEKGSVEEHVELNGDVMEFSFNSVYMRECISAVIPPSFKILSNSNNAQNIITPLVFKVDEHQRIMIMPIKP